MSSANPITDPDVPSPAPSLRIKLAPSALEGAGRGVFSTQPIKAGELIESCPMIVLPDRKDRGRLRKTGLVNYYFLWGENRDAAAICLGFGSIYNHSYQPNARYLKRIPEAQMDFYALRDIAEGEEITVNYNGVPTDTKPLWIRSIPPANAADQLSAHGITARLLARPKRSLMVSLVMVLVVLTSVTLISAWLQQG